MENNSLSSRLSIIQPILIKYFQEKERIEQEIIREGRVPKTICSLCEGYGVKRWIEPFTKDEERDVSRFIKSMKENKIASINRLADFERMVYPTSYISIETSQEIGRKKPEPTKKGLKRYTYRISEFKKRTFCPQGFREILKRFDWIVSCAHFEIDNGEVVHLAIKYKGSEQLELEGGRLRYDALLLCCRGCKAEIEKRGCTRGISKDGFIYSKICDLDFLLLQEVLKEAELPFELGHGHHPLLESTSPDFYLREYETLIMLHGPYLTVSPEPAKQRYEALISTLKPNLIVCFGDKTKIIELLGYATNVLVASKEGFYKYDCTRPVEESFYKIVRSVVEKLDDYAEETRGNEHDRLIKAFERIGQELGYVPEREYGKRGLRVDCVWYDRQGNIRVAIEVETRGGWKKDIACMH